METRRRGENEEMGEREGGLIEWTSSVLFDETKKKHQVCELNRQFFVLSSSVINEGYIGYYSLVTQ